MIIPNADKAVVDIRKLRDYCLNPLHEEGKHKARLFAASLGMTINDAQALQKILLTAITANEAQLGRSDDFGQRYIVDFVLQWRERQTIIRSGWILEFGSNIPKLTTCFPR